MKKTADPNETYKVRELFACGEGHCLPSFTHWEEGEVCPHGHSDEASNEDVHLYYRNLLVPVKADDEKTDLWKKIISPEHRGKWGHFPVAP